MSAVPPGFRPRGAGTGLGPMPAAPGDDPAAVVAAVVESCPELPFWPARPRSGQAEGPLGRWATGLPGVEVRDSRAIWAGRSRAEGQTAPPADSLATLEPFHEHLAVRPPGGCLLPALGPVSLAL